jgi:hypothetical protein
LLPQDWNDGRIPYFTTPPSRGNEEFQSAEIVATWAKEFNAEEVRHTKKRYYPQNPKNLFLAVYGSGLGASGPREGFQVAWVLDF